MDLVGDKVLKTIAHVIRFHIRQSDFFACFGGEEFVLLLPEASLEAAITAAEKLRKRVEECNFHYQEAPVPVTISCGIAQFQPNDTPESVLKRADESLYLAKKRGKPLL